MGAERRGSAGEARLKEIGPPPEMFFSGVAAENAPAETANYPTLVPCSPSGVAPPSSLISEMCCVSAERRGIPPVGGTLLLSIKRQVQIKAVNKKKNDHRRANARASLQRGGQGGADGVNGGQAEKLTTTTECFILCWRWFSQNASILPGGPGAACQSQFKVHEISMSIDCSRGERTRGGGGGGVSDSTD